MMATKLLLGFHVSISGSIDKAVDRAKEMGCMTFQIFTRNPRGWKSKALSEEEIKEFPRKVEQYGIRPPVAHSPYLPNLASPKDEIYQLSLTTVMDELKRCGDLRIPYFVLHMGSHLGAGFEAGFKRLVSGCNQALKKVENDVMLLLENMAGQANSMGSKFEDIGRVLKAIQYQDRVGVCIDSCHMFAAGYELRSEKAFKKTMDELDEHVGLERVKVVHLNDSQGAVGSGLDRHEHIGIGYIGEKGFSNILHFEAFRGLPYIMETPVDSRRDNRGNLMKVRELWEASK